MLGSYVCRQCRSRLARRIVPVRNPQWQPRATFFSFRRQTPQDKSEATTADAHAPQEALEESEQPTSRRRHVDRLEQSQSRPQRRAGRYSRLVDEPGEDEFLSSTSPQANHLTSEGGGQGPIGALANAVESPGNGDKAWKLFNRIYTSRDCEALTHPAESDRVHLKDGKLFDDLLRKVNSAFCYAPVKPRVTPTMVLLAYEQLGVIKPEHWTFQTLDFLTHQAIRAVNSPSEVSKLDLPTILQELLSVWRLFFQCKGKNAHTRTAAEDWNLPALNDLPQNFPKSDFSLRLNEYHPGQLGNSVLAFCAVYLYTLSDALRSNEALNKLAEPFVQFLGRLLMQARITPVMGHAQRSTRFRKLPEDVQKDIIQELDNAPHKAMDRFAAQGETLDDGMEGNSFANREAFHLKRIERATSSRKSAVSLERLWTEANEGFTTNGKITIPPRVYDAFMKGFLILNLAQRSVDVWNHMIAHGVEPTMQSWVALLEGCEKAKDLAGFDAMWSRMLSMGVEPDDYAWTTRVHGLFDMREIKLGLAALDDMGKRWLAAENRRQPKNKKSGAKVNPKTVNPCAKPSIEVVNGAITALVSLQKRDIRHEKRVEFVHKLLGWASGFDIKPDTITYNSLIQMYLLGADNRTAFKVLRQMEQSGIKADIATHAMLMNLVFTNPTFKQLTPTEQGEKIINQLNSIEASGIKLNDYIYSTAIDRFLKYYSNDAAVRMVVEHMQKRDLVPSPYAYTSLITHYFQQEPPLIAAVDSLVNQFFTAHSVATDRTLFDRILEGYASHGEVRKMMNVLTRMPLKGAVPSWNALVAVIEALVRDGDFDRARRIVKDVQNGTGIAESYIFGGSSDERRFFHTVQKLGIEVEEERMGDYMRPDSGAFTQRTVDQMVESERPVRASRDEKELGEQLQEQEIQQMTRKEEVQDDLERMHEQSQSTLGSRYDRAMDQGTADKEPLPADEEDVHEFLKDDHDDYHARVDRR